MVNKDLVDSVKDNPEVAFAAFANWYVWIPVLWLLFLSFQGLLRVTNTSSPQDLVKHAVKGLVQAKKVGLKGVKKVAVRKGVFDMLIYAIGITVLLILYYTVESKSNVAFGSVLAFIIIYFLNKKSHLGSRVSKYVEAFLRGLVTGGIIVLIIWFISKFTVSQENMLGDIVFILVSLYFAFTVMTFVGYSNT